MSHTGWHKEHCFLSSVLISSLWHCCISAHLRLSISPALEDRTQQPNSWEFWGVWHLDWQQRTSKLFPASVPTPCQAVALIKGGPNYAHFYAIRGISFHRRGLFLSFFFFFYNRQNIQKKCTTLCDPNSATDVAAKRQQWARSCCSCSLKHSWGILVFGFYATYIVSRSKPFTSSDAFCFLFFFPAWLSFFLEPRSHMLVPSKLHCHIQADEGDDTRRTSGCDMHTHTHTHPRALTRTHSLYITQMLLNAWRTG